MTPKLSFGSQFGHQEGKSPGFSMGSPMGAPNSTQFSALENLSLSNSGPGMNTGTGLQLGDVNSIMPPMPGAGGAGGQGGFLSGIGGLDGIGTILGGLGDLGQIFASMKSLKLAQDQFDFNKDAYNTNVENQTQTYNTSLEDRIRARYKTEGRSAADVDSYLSKNRL